MSQPMMLTSTHVTTHRKPQENGRWRAIRFPIARHGFESRLERILRAAYAHESNGLTPGDYEYEVLNEEAEAICNEFANRWGLDVDLLKAHVPGLAKLEALASLPPERDWVGLARVAAIVIPVACFLMGAAAGLFSLGFHLMGGR